jgi:hypothetical protein
MLINLGSLEFDSDTVLRQLRRDLHDDWFPDPREFNDLFDKEHVPTIIQENFKRNHGEYVPAKRLLLNVPKANFTLRYALETSLADRVLYHALAAHLVKFYDPLLPWCVFSHRHDTSTKNDGYLFKRAVPSWQDFMGVVRNSLNTPSVLLSTDITNFFENINLSKLQETLMMLLPETAATAAEMANI